MKNFLNKTLTASWLQHLGFWVLSLYAVGSYFSISNELKTIDFIYSFFFHIPLLWLVYVNLRYHIPRFLLKRRYALYLFLSLVNLAAAYFIHQVLFDMIVPILPTDFYMVSFTDASVLLTIFIIYLVLTTLLKLSKSWYELQQLEKEKLSLELNSLKMQINPHFLFNSLNSMYSLARKKSDKTPDAILRLSNLMRYMIYEVSEEVALSKEVDSINDYLNLQKLRTEEDASISFNVEGKLEDRMIAPLLFFPLIENSFKHGLKGEKGSNFVDISLKNTTSELQFRVTNNKGAGGHSEDGKYGGIGLNNVKKRLHLIYGEQAQIEVTDTDKSFDVTINIKWNDQMPDCR